MRKEPHYEPRWSYFTAVRLRFLEYKLTYWNHIIYWRNRKGSIWICSKPGFMVFSQKKKAFLMNWKNSHVSKGDLPFGGRSPISAPRSLVPDPRSPIPDLWPPIPGPRSLLFCLSSKITPQNPPQNPPKTPPKTSRWPFLPKNLWYRKSEEFRALLALHISFPCKRESRKLWPE